MPKTPDKKPLMVEGNTIDGIERLTGASKHTILRLLELAGTACMAHHDRGPDRKYSPGQYVGSHKRRVLGQPHKALVSTSYVEKHNQTMRLHMKRYARLAAAHSKRIENHVHMVALYTTWYNLLA